MAKEINSVSLSGNLGKAPEHREVGNGMASFSLAVNRFYRDDKAEQGYSKKTSWFRCVAWGPVATAIMEKLGKGDRVMVQGQLSQSVYLNKAKQKTSAVEVVIDSFSLLKDAEEAVEDEVGEEVVVEEDDPPIEAAKAALKPTPTTLPKATVASAKRKAA